MIIKGGVVGVLLLSLSLASASSRALANEGRQLLVVPKAHAIEEGASPHVMGLHDHGLVERHIPGPEVFVVRVPDDETPDGFRARLMATGDFAIIEPDRRVRPTGSASATVDQFAFRQWHLPHLRAAEAWARVPSNAPAPIIAVLDTGIDSDHPDLVDRLVPGYNSATRLREVDGGDIEDINGHGTRCAGIAAATVNNGVGVASIANSARIMPIRVTNKESGSASLSALFDGIRYAADNGARVVSVSYAGVSSGTAEVTAAYARTQGCMVIWSTDNFGFDYSWFDHPNITIVASTDQQDELMANVSTGSAVDIVAPGKSIYTTARNGSYNYDSGVSYATPIVAGTAALVLSVNPALTPAQVESILIATSLDLGAAGDDEVYGAGLVQPERAALAAGSASDFDGNGETNLTDFAMYIDAWGIGDLRADLDLNGLVELSDFSVYIGAWSDE